MSAKHRKHDYQTARTLAQPGVLVFSHENLWDLVNLVKLSTTPEKVGPVTSLDDLLHRMGRQATEQLRRHVADELGRWAKRDVYWYVDKLSKHMFKMDFAKGRRIARRDHMQKNRIIIECAENGFMITVEIYDESADTPTEVNVFVAESIKSAESTLVKLLARIRP